MSFYFIVFILLSLACVNTAVCVFTSPRSCLPVVKAKTTFCTRQPFLTKPDYYWSWCLYCNDCIYGDVN